MDIYSLKINLVIAWLWIILGFVSGFIFGSYFHSEGWLGGYSSFKRRLYRLAHISFFGMAIINLLFYFTIRILTVPSHLVDIPSWGFIIGAISMPACCIMVAHNAKLRAIFLIPVISLIVAGSITFWEIMQL